MNPRKVPGVPPRPLFAIVVALRNVLLRVWRKLAPAEVVMFESIFQGLQTVHIARAACQLELPEHLADGPRSVEDLALASGTKPELLARFLRTLASYEILVEHGDSRYALAPLGRTLLPGSAGSMRGAVLMGGSRWMQDLWHALAETLRTGKTGFEVAYGCDSWKYFADHPDARRDFDEAMVNLTTTDAPAFARAVDFSRAKRVCDVGGGRGTLLAHVLAQHPHLEGVLFDDAVVVGQARPVLDMWGVAERVQLVGGDFFVAIPPGCDVYFLRQVIHDWDDARATRILRTVRAAMQPGQRVLLYEMLRPEPVSQHPVFSLDLMHAGRGSRPRAYAGGNGGFAHAMRLPAEARHTAGRPARHRRRNCRLALPRGPLHKQFRHVDGRVTTVPMHAGRDISPTLLRQICRDIRMPVPEFVAA